MSEGRKKHHHIVSKGYLRQFASEVVPSTGRSSYWESRLILKAALSAGGPGVPAPKLVGIGSMFAREHFNSFRDGDTLNAALEDQWADIEDDSIPALRRLLDGDRRTETIIRCMELFALHVARSEGMLALHKRVLQNGRTEQPEKVIEDPLFDSLFRQAQGRAPELREISHLVAQSLDDLAEERLHWVQGMARGFNLTMDFCRESKVTILHATGAVDFLSSDTPVVMVEGTKIGFQGGTGLKVAEVIFMPLSARVAWQVGGEGGDQRCPPFEVQRMNTWMLRNARYALAAHPDTDWHRALGLRRAPTPVSHNQQ